MRATNEELRAVSEELERTQTDPERLIPVASQQILEPLRKFSAHALHLSDQFGQDFDSQTMDWLNHISQHAGHMAAAAIIGL